MNLFFAVHSQPTLQGKQFLTHSMILLCSITLTGCVGIRADGATAMTAKYKGLATHVSAVVPNATAIHCCIHREQLAVKEMPEVLKTVLYESLKMVNKIKIAEHTSF